MKRIASAGLVLLAVAAGPAAAQDYAAVEARADLATGYASGDVETLGIDIRADSGVLWSGTLTLGPQYGNAYYSQSKNEFAEPCEGDRKATSRGTNSNNSLNFNISRANWQQEPDQFNVSFTWTRALSACEGQGTDTYGFNRMIEIEQGSSVTIDGPGGTRVTVSRQR